MKSTFTLIFYLLPVSVFAQGLSDKELKTTLKEVTVFLDAAQMFESGTVSIPAGKSLLRIKSLSPFIDDKSIQVKAEGDFTILSVNHKFNYLKALKNNRIVDSLQNLHESLENRAVIEEARLSVLKEKQSLLDANKNIGSQNNGLALTQLKQAIDFYDSELSKIKDEEIRIRKSIAAKREEQNRLSQQLKEQHSRKILPSSEIEIQVKSEKIVQGSFAVSYLVGNAGWFPKYDIRVKNIASPLMLTYKAEVFQNTGTDWKNVKLRFSNGTPNQSGVAPELKPWTLNYARYTTFDKSAAALMNRQRTGAVKGRVIDDSGEPLPGVNVVVKGTTIGTVTDANGNYSITLPQADATLVFSFIGYSSQELAVNRPEMNVKLASEQAILEEVVVTGYGNAALSGRANGIQLRGVSSVAPKTKTVLTSFIENQTTVEIEVKEPYSIKSDGEKLLVDLKVFEVPAEYEYYAVPKIDKDAFLIAQIVQWDQYNLLEGEANLYFEDAYIGRSVLNAKSLTDTLSVSLGRDKNIVIGRTKIEQFSRRKIMGTNKTETRGFKISVRNKKSQPVKLTLFDQLPVSIASDITVEALELSGGELDSKSGKITWRQKIDPQQQKELTLQYEVRYPKKEGVILE